MPKSESVFIATD